MSPDPQRRPRESAAEVDRYYLELWQRSGFALNPPEKRRWHWMTRVIRRFGPAATAGKLLDYGCGSGRFLPLLESTALGPVVGFDVTRSVLDEVARRHPQAEIVVGDGTYPTPLPDAAFRLAVSTEVIEHVIDQAAFITDLARVLTPGGLLLLTTPNARFETAYKATTTALQPIENWLDGSALATLLRDAGLEILVSRTTGAHQANMPYQRLAPYRLGKRVARRFRFWTPIDAVEQWLAGALGRGITLLVAARRPG